MATDKKKQTAQETEEKTDVNESEVAEMAEAESSEPLKVKTKKKGGFGTFFFFIVLVAVIAVASVPQLRESVVAGFKNHVASVQNDEQVEIVETGIIVEPLEAAEPEEIAVRLEQLENARDFENAEVVVATVEPLVPDAKDINTAVLEQQQIALLAEIERLRTQIEAVQDESNSKIESLRNSMPKTGLIEERLLAMAAKTDALEQQVVQNGVKTDRVERSKADASTVLALLTRMEITEQKVRASNVEKERAAALLLAVYQMREAALSGQRFLTEQQSALALASFRPRLAEYIRRLTVAADQGVWSKTALIISFNDYADRAVMSEQLSKKDDWFHKALNKLRSLIVIRRIDGPANDMSTQAIIARAQQSVDDEDFPIAIVQLNDLQGEPAAIMKEWVTAAERHVVTKKTINEAISAVLGVVFAQQVGE